MSPRPYRLGRREATVEETRERVISAARNVFAKAGFAQASLDVVARRAKVARATVYYQFGSKAGLLEAAIAGVVSESSRERVRRATELDDPRAALVAYIDEISRLWESDRAFYRNVIGLAVLEPEVSTAVNQYDNRRREGLTWLVKRLQDAGLLPPDMSHKRAVDLLWTLTSFRSYDHLRRYVSLPPKETTAVVRTLALSVLAT